MLATLQKIETAALLIAALIALVILQLWFYPQLDRFAPAFWSKMTANTAAAMLVAVGALSLSMRQGPAFQRHAGMALGAIVLTLSTLTLVEYIGHVSFGIDTLLPHRLNGPYPGRPTPQGALAFTLLGLSAVCLRQCKNLRSRVADIAALLFLTLNFVILGGDFFGAIEHVSIYSRIIMSPQTLLAFFCLNTVIVLRRAEHGDLLAVLVNIGIGSRMVRLILPLVLVMPFILLGAAAYMVNSRSMNVIYAESLTAAFAAVLTLCLLTWSGWRINALERDLRDLSLTDELTGVFNRRGFYFLGRQTVREAQRARSGLSVFFFDLDGLKLVNDVLGHEAGSEMIGSFATVLNNSFRKSDIIGRVGGDEFAVITIRDNAMWIESIRARLRQFTDAHNGDASRNFRLSFSTGYAELSHGQIDTLDAMITRADGLMYEEKAKKKLAA